MAAPVFDSQPVTVMTCPVLDALASDGGLLQKLRQAGIAEINKRFSVRMSAEALENGFRQDFEIEDGPTVF